MNGIRISFAEGGPRFDFRTPIKEFYSTVQNALVNVGTDMGSDKIFVERGTNLKRDGAQGRMATTVWSNHSANFAALRTLSFAQQNDQETNSWKLQSFTLRCEQLVQDQVTLAVQAVSAGGQTVGGLANI